MGKYGLRNIHCCLAFYEVDQSLHCFIRCGPRSTKPQDALSRLFQKVNINFGRAKDIRGSLKRLEIGSTLGITELLQICALLDNTSRIKSYGRREKENEQRVSLEDLFDALEPLPLLNTEIRRCILSEDEIADDASAT